MKSYRVALATEAGFPDLYQDDQLLVAPLAALGIATVPAVWDSPEVPWDGFDGVFLRSTWDYFKKPERFTTWIDSLEEKNVPLWNPASVVKWNLDKRYLAELEGKGFPIVPTRWLSFSSPAALADFFRQSGWEEAVVKPTLSAGSWHTVRLSRNEPMDFEALARIPQGMPLMLQPFLDAIRTEGEWSFLFFNGKYSHAVLKTPADGDFRVQLQYGGTIATPPPPEPALRLAEALIDELDLPLLYARVDLVRERDQFRLMEIELVEPHLYLEFDKEAPRRLAAALHKALTASTRACASRAD